MRLTHVKLVVVGEHDLWDAVYCKGNERWSH